MDTCQHEHDIQLVISIFTILKNWEYEGKEEIGLVILTSVLPREVLSHEECWHDAIRLLWCRNCPPGGWQKQTGQNYHYMYIWRGVLQVWILQVFSSECYYEGLCTLLLGEEFSSLSEKWLDSFTSLWLSDGIWWQKSESTLKVFRSLQEAQSACWLLVMCDIKQKWSITIFSGKYLLIDFIHSCRINYLDT